MFSGLYCESNVQQFYLYNKYQTTLVFELLRCKLFPSANQILFCSQMLLNLNQLHEVSPQ